MQIFFRSLLLSGFFFSIFTISHGYSTEISVKEQHSSSISCELDYLFWFANQSDLHYGTTLNGSTPILDPEWSSGIRAGISIQPSSWDTKVYYTYYATSSNDEVDQNITSILSSCPATSGVFAINAEWKLRFNRFDWELGRKFCFSHDFVLRPFWGIQGLNTHQQFNLDTKTVFLDLNTGLPAIDVVSSDNKNRFLSLGLRAGFNVFFPLGIGLELYGNFSGSILWGKCKWKQQYTQTDLYEFTFVEELVKQTNQLSQSSSIFNYDLGIGSQWKYSFQKRKLQLLLKFGWEQHYYADMIRFQDFHLQQVSSGTAAYASNGNLTLSGFIFTILLGY